MPTSLCNKGIRLACVYIKSDQYLDLSTTEKLASSIIAIFYPVCVAEKASLTITWTQSYKPFFMLNSTEHETSSANKN